MSRSLREPGHYVDVLSFRMHWQWSEPNRFEESVRPTFASMERGEIALFLCEQGQGNPGSWLCLNVPSRNDLEAIFRESTSSTAQKTSRGACAKCFVRDPDGNTFRIGTLVQPQDYGAAVTPSA